MDLRSLPKAHLHLHLEATLRPATILELYRRQGGQYASLTLEEVTRCARMTADDTSFGDFLGKFQFILGCLETPADLVRVAQEAIADAEIEGIRYVELRFCPHSMQPRCGIPAPAAILVDYRTCDNHGTVCQCLVVNRSSGNGPASDRAKLTRNRGLSRFADVFFLSVIPACYTFFGRVWCSVGERSRQPSGGMGGPTRRPRR